MTRALLFLTLLAAAAAADFLVNSTYNAQFVVIRNPFTNTTYTFLYPPQGYLCLHGVTFYINVGNTLYYFDGRSITAYAWPGAARFCDSSLTSCYMQRGMVFPLYAFTVVESAPRALYVYNSTTERWEPIFNKRLLPGTLASISPTSPPFQYLANLTFIDTVDNKLKTEEFSVVYYVSSGAWQERGRVICLRVNETLFPFYSSLLHRTVVPLHAAQRGDVYYVLNIEVMWEPVYADGFLFSSAGYYSLINHTTFVARYYIFKKDYSLFEFLRSPYFYLPVGSKTSGAAKIETFGTYSLEAAFFTEKHYAYYLSKPPERVASRSVYLVGENNTIVVASFKGDDGITYAAFPLCPIDKIIFYVSASPYRTVDRIFDTYGAAMIQNNSTKTLYIILIESGIFATDAYKSAQVLWVWRVKPGGAAVVPAVAGYYQLLYALDSPCTGEYLAFAPIPGYRYVFDGETFSLVSEGSQAEWIELFKQLLKLLSSLHNQTTAVLKHPQGYTYSGQSIVSVATSLSSSVQLQNVYAFSIAAQQGSAMAFGGISIPAAASIALALLLAFAVAVGVAKTREDPADRLAAVYAVFVPAVAILSLFFASDLASAAVIAAVLIALAYAVHTARL
ncbi:MAG: hypothetical protein QXT13_13250 [Pyrobaculum sp.]